MLDRWALRRFHRAVAVSEGVAVALRRGGVAPEKITTISNGVDVAVFSAGRPTLAAEIGKGNRLVVGMVSRLVRGKGADYFLHAASDVLSCFPETLFVLVGEGSARKELERLARELGIEKKVIFTGQRADMPGVYASLDVFVLPSLNEGMPLTVLEAQAANRAVIASRVGAVPQLIQHRETGLLIEPGDVFFFQAEDGIRDLTLTGVQTCALPIYARASRAVADHREQAGLGAFRATGRSDVARES